MSRNLFIDYLKGIAIFLVVWGHGIQFLDVEYNCFENTVFLFIYSFHMPLFMCISGYLFAFSVRRKTFLEMVEIKFNQLVLPIICWGPVFTWLVYYKELQSLNDKTLWFRYIWLYLRSLPYHLWFLWSLFVISAMVSFCSRKKLNEIAVNTLVFFLLLCLPDSLGLSYIKFMYPFFLMGYFYNIYAAKLQRFKNYLVYSSYIIFPLCFLKWSKSDLIYFTEMSFYDVVLTDHLHTITLRYIIGFTGVVVAVTSIKKFFYFPKLAFVTTMGVFSLGIYIIQSVLFYIIILYSPVHNANVYLYTFVYSVLLALVLVVISIHLTKLIGRVPILSKILFGGRY
jgi:fucose 4-O-acetylase-like acetyltransferase